jgi:pilus assembly protein CpaF
MVAMNMLASGDEAFDSEMSPAERRLLTVRIAEQVGKIVAVKVEDAAESGRPMAPDVEKVAAASEIQRLLGVQNEVRLRNGDRALSTALHQALFDGVMAHAYGLAGLDELWNNPDVENIVANGPDDVYVTFAGGKSQRWSSIAGSQEEMIDLIRRAARRLGLIEVDFDGTHYRLDLQLPDGSRLYAVYGGANVNGVSTEPQLSLRRHRFQRLTISDTVRMGLWPSEAAAFVKAAFRAGFNVFIAGDWNSGKTTLLRALCLDAIPKHQRVITVEAGLTELGLHRCRDQLENVVALFSRPPSAQGDGEVTVWELIKGPTRRLTPTRVIVGEVLGDEVGPVLDVFSGSTKGSGCTIHARSAAGVVSRLEQLAAMANPPISSDGVRKSLVEAMPVIVHLAYDEDENGVARRYCTSIVEVNGMEGGDVSKTELWGLNDRDELVPREALSTVTRNKLRRWGWDWETDGWAHRLEGQC